MKTKSPRKFLIASVFAFAFGILSSQGSTIAYWRFEDQPDGGQLIGNMGGGPFTVTQDYSTNGNGLRTFNGPAAPNTSGTFVSLVPGSTIPQTGASNVRSAEFAGAGQDFYVYGAGNLETFPFGGDFTIELSLRSTALGWRTALGRDQGSLPGPTGNLYYQQRGDSGVLRIAVLDGTGTLREIDSSLVVANTATWFNTALVSSGTTLTLYNFNGSTWDVIGSTTTAGGLRADSATWTVGRGWFAGPNDFWAGQLDEIRISSTALTTDQFLWSIPEPGSMALAVMGLGVMLLRRKRRTVAEG